jgi:sulfite exporter TauE/SafE
MFYTAFLLGLVGSVHCAAMCGPLALATPTVDATRRSAIYSRLVYNAGRLFVYGLFGIGFGLIGQSILLAGLQQFVSVGTGSAMLAFLLLGLYGVANPFGRTSFRIRRIFRRFLADRSFVSTFILGAVNGFLPCGLVYMAGTASLASGNVLASGIYMLVFGLGTLPVMMGVTVYRGRLLDLLGRMRFVPIVPIAVTLVAFSLILRGLGLGIPYVSPAKTTDGLACPACSLSKK